MPMTALIKHFRATAQNIKTKVISTVRTAENRLTVKAMNTKAKLAGETGANTHTDVSIWIVIGVTLGAIALAILIILFRDTVMKEVTNMINEMFSRKTQTS